MKKRILWLLNHTTLREFEVPMLIEMGYEVFTPKIYQYEFGDLSASVTWEYDASLTIPQDALEFLNRCDMYQEDLPARAIEIMNKYFDIAVFGAFTSQIKMLVRTFRGLMIFQAFGLEATMNYSKLFAMESLTFLDEICNLGERFWFGATYENLPEVECEYFKKQYVYLPIGLKNDTVNRIWSGGDERILFIGPRIMTSPYYHKVYCDFKKNFGMIPHVIGGAQMIQVPNDPAVVGFLPKEQFEYNMRHLAAMYYHSREPRHLHYHPLEAVTNGMPLVFMAGGMLDHIGGGELPGRCETISQARHMLQRLSAGDMNLAEKIVEKQGCLLDTFRNDFCREKWQTAFRLLQERMMVNVSPLKEEQAFCCNIAVIIPQPYTGGVLDFALRLAIAIQNGAEQQKDRVQVIVYYMDDEVYRERDYFEALKLTGIKTRSYRWVYRKKSWFDNLAVLKNYDSGVLPRKANVMEDGISDLRDIDYCIFASDRIPSPFFTVKKHAIVVHDVIQRYVSQMLDFEYEVKRQAGIRSADRVLVTTPCMHEAVMNYIGLADQKIVDIPPLYENVSNILHKPVDRSGGYFIWATNCAPHKNHKKALRALSDYYAGGGRLKCYVTGANTELFLPQYQEDEKKDTKYATEIRKMIADDMYLQENIIINGELGKISYFQCLSGAEFIFHPGYADNGNGACVEALQLGVPVLSAKYPAMEYMNQRLNANMIFFNPFNVRDMAEKIHYMEYNARRIADNLPSCSELKKYTIDEQFPMIYHEIRSMIRGY